jgi:hypothetical protein
MNNADLPGPLCHFLTQLDESRSADNPRVEVKVPPLQRDYLAAASAEHRGQPEVEAPFR